MNSTQNAECVKALNSDKQLRELRKLLSEAQDEQSARDLKLLIAARIMAIKSLYE